MIEGRDFEVLSKEADLSQGQLAPIRILIGKYKGVKYKYGTVEANQHSEKGAVLRLKFQYVVLDKNGIEEEIDKQKEFVDTIGEILNKIILDRYSKGEFVKVGENNGNR